VRDRLQRGAALAGEPVPTRFKGAKSVRLSLAGSGLAGPERARAETCRSFGLNCVAGFDLVGRSDADQLVPKAVVMLTLAQHYAPKNSAEAAKLLNQIKSDYPDSPIAEQADQALALLPGKS